jgi:hypothetical protein
MGLLDQSLVGQEPDHADKEVNGNLNFFTVFDLRGI